MNSIQKFYLDGGFGEEKTEEKLSKNAIEVIEIYKLLSPLEKVEVRKRIREDKILVKRIIALEKVF